MNQYAPMRAAHISFPYGFHLYSGKAGLVLPRRLHTMQTVRAGLRQKGRSHPKEVEGN